MADPEQERLDEIEARIQSVKHDAEEHGTVPDEDEGQTFADPEGDGTDDPYQSSPPG
jgi:hypothetical protein